MRLYFLTLIFAAQIYNASAQTDSILTQINNDVWFPFIETYANLDDVGFMAIHTEDVIRVNRDGKRIKIGKEYAESMKRNSEWGKENKVQKTIEFSFLERIAREDVAFEVGYYKVKRKKGEEAEQVFYGKFQVVLKKMDGKWKIFLDSDTSNNGTIGEDDFQSGEMLR